MSAAVRVGRIPVGLALIAYGVVKITDSLHVTSGATSLLLKLWPLLLIALGVEYLIRSALGASQSTPLRFDFGGLFLLLLAVALGSGISAVQWAIERGIVSIAQAPVVRTVTADAPAAGVRRLRIVTGAGRIELRPGSSDTIHVEATLSAPVPGGADPAAVARRLEQAQITVSPGESARIDVNVPALGGTSPSVSYSVTLPAGLQVEADSSASSIQVFDYRGDLHLTSRTGPIDVEAGSGSLQAEADTGSVLIRSFSGAVSARTGLGRIEAIDTAGDLRLDTQSGTLVVTGFRGGGLEAHTSLGSIQATTDVPLAGDVRLATQSGSLTLSVPGSSRMRVSARTGGGSLNVPPFVQRSRDGIGWSGSGILGDGRYQVDLQTQLGSITLIAQ